MCSEIVCHFIFMYHRSSSRELHDTPCRFIDQGIKWSIGGSQRLPFFTQSLLYDERGRLSIENEKSFMLLQ